MARKTVGLALGSGAIRGLVHVGVIRALLKHHIPIDYLAGSSVGAWIAAHYAIYQDLAALEEKTVGFKSDKFKALLDPTLHGGVIRGKKIEQLLYHWLGDVTFSKTKLPLAVLATDLISGKTIVLNEGPIVPAVRASMAIPLMFQPVTYRHYLLVDGGVTNPVPDDVISNMGADIVIGVNLNQALSQQQFNTRDLSFRAVASRIIELTYYNVTEMTTHTADVLIQPSINLFGFKAWKKYFTEDTIVQLVELGEAATLPHIPKIQQLLQR